MGSCGPSTGLFKISGSNAGLHLILTDRRGRSEEELAGQAEAAGVKVYQMRHFRMEETDREPAMLILGYGALSQEKIKEGVALLKKVWL